MATTFIGKEALEQMAVNYHEEVMMSGVYFRDAVISRLRIKVIQGVEFLDVINVLHRKGHQARRKVVGDELKSQLGYIEERKLEAQLIWDRYPDNKDNYVAEKVISTLGTNDTMAYPAAELAFKGVIANFGSDLFECLWHGDASIDRTTDNGWLGLYDGFITYLNKDINLGRISTTRQNYVELDTIPAPTGLDDYTAWTIFQDFIDKWHPLLKNQPEVLVYCSTKTRLNIATAYTNFHHSYKEPAYASEGTRFAEYPNVLLLDEASFGVGDKLIATVPDNFTIGVDTNSSKQMVHVQVGSDKDAADIFFQLQTIMGVRVDNVSPQIFCMSDGALAQGAALSGDYLKNSITVVSANTAQGTVAKSVDKDEYAVGETVNLTATPLATFVFDTWADGVKDNPRTVVGLGQPMVYIAKFKAE